MKIVHTKFELLIDQILKFEERNNCFLYKVPGLINLTDSVLVVEDEDYDAPEEIDGYFCSLSWSGIKDVLDNLSSQIPNPTLENYAEAINYYIENDAFIDRENLDNQPEGGYKIWGK